MTLQEAKKLQKFSFDEIKSIPNSKGIYFTWKKLDNYQDLIYVGKSNNRWWSIWITVKMSKRYKSNGAGFIVAIAGDIMTMPGLPKVLMAEKIDIDNDGVITGLF